MNTNVLAALIHAGVFISDYEHAQARTAEGVIAAVLIIGSTSCSCGTI